MTSTTERLEMALGGAVSLYEESMGEPFPGEISLTEIENAEFVAIAAPNGDDGVHIAASSGLVADVVALWDAIGSEPSFAEADPELSHVSLIWLMLHELHHFQMGHFRLTGGSGIVEAGTSEAFGLVSRAPQAALISEFPADLRMYARHCLELQADNDSTDMLLGPWPEREDWADFRHRLAGIMAMMMLIDRQEDQRQRFDTHPGAAARIFMTLGHVAELWTVPARAKAQAAGRDSISPDNLPPDELVAAWNSEIVLPALDDALRIAEAAGATRVVEALGNSADLFADISIAQTVADPPLDLFKTDGGKEWALLWPVNGQVLHVLGLPTLNVPASA